MLFLFFFIFPIIIREAKELHVQLAQNRSIYIISVGQKVMGCRCEYYNANIGVTGKLLALEKCSPKSALLILHHPEHHQPEVVIGDEFGEFPVMAALLTEIQKAFMKFFADKLCFLNVKIIFVKQHQEF